MLKIELVMDVCVNPTPPNLSALDTLWLCETIRLREEQAGALDDSEANRQAIAAGGSLSQRIINRALWLAQRDGQLTALLHWQHSARLALFALLVLALLSGMGLAVAALSNGLQPVNVFWALGSLLGLNTLMLLLWALLPNERGGALGRLWLWLSGKLARDASALQLAPALALTLHRGKLSRWLLGLLSHGLWCVIFCSALISLLLMLATRRYGFVWETTILSSEAFISLTHALGALPALLGFSLPDEALIRASGTSALSDEAARQTWASWLMGVTVIYGLLPRLLLCALCAWRWQAGKRNLTLDVNEPAYAALRSRLQPDSERLGVSDIAPDALHHVQAGQLQEAGSGVVLLGIELYDHSWPPLSTGHLRDAGIIDSREQRQRVLEQLTRYPAERLLIVCDPQRSPDRGTLGLLGELSRCAGATRIWLLPAKAESVLDAARLQDWQHSLQRLELPYSDSAPSTWLETGHD